MSHHRKKHTCKNHRATVARGKCVRCGAWICSECALVKGGRFYCRLTCADVPVTSAQPVGEPVAPALADNGPVGRAVRNPVAPLPAIVSLVSLVISVCAVVLALRIDKGARFYTEERGKLTALIREDRQEILALRDEVQWLRDSLGCLPAAAAMKTKPAPQAAPGAGAAWSFDNGTTAHRLVALTFDGSDHVNAAADILDTLKSRGVAVTMFLTGRFIERYPEVARRIVADGHETGNHTWSHPRLTTWAQDRTHTTLEGVTESFLAAELRKTAETFERVTGRRLAPLWRAPYGERNYTLCRWAHAAGYLHVGWRQGRSWRQSLDSNDWVPDEETPGYHTPAEVYEKIMDIARSKPYGINGGIILMHLGTVRTDRRQQVHLVLGAIIDDLRAMGYEFVTVSALAARSGVDLSVPGAAGAAAGAR